MRDFIASIGRSGLSLASFLGGIVLFTIQSVKRVGGRPFFLSPLLEQIQFVGIRSIPLVTVAALAIGLVMAMQTAGLLIRFGSPTYMASIVGLGMVRELGPMITALMVAGRCASGISAELGSMKVTNQIDAIRVSAVDPLRFLVVPRLLALLLALPLLTVWADLVGIFGGLVVSVTQLGVTPSSFIHMTVRFVTLQDFIGGLSKTLVFGMIIGAVGCYQGFSTTMGTAGVGRSTTTAVVASSLLILVADIFLTRLTM